MEGELLSEEDLPAISTFVILSQSHVPAIALEGCFDRLISHPLNFRSPLWRA